MLQLSGYFKLKNKITSDSYRFIGTDNYFFENENLVIGYIGDVYINGSQMTRN